MLNAHDLDEIVALLAGTNAMQSPDARASQVRAIFTAAQLPPDINTAGAPGEVTLRIVQACDHYGRGNRAVFSCRSLAAQQTLAQPPGIRVAHVVDPTLHTGDPKGGVPRAVAAQAVSAPPLGSEATLAVPAVTRASSVRAVTPEVYEHAKRGFPVSYVALGVASIRRQTPVMRWSMTPIGMSRLRLDMTVDWLIRTAGLCLAALVAALDSRQPTCD